MEAKDQSGEKPGGNGYEALSVEKSEHGRKRRRRLAACLAVAAVVMILFVVVLALALTVFKQRDPQTEIVSVSVEGVSPRVSLPALRIELNVTLDLVILVKNRNYAGFRHGAGTSLLLYRGTRFGEADISPGTIPARGSTTVPCSLTLEVDELGSDLGELITDVVAGQIAVETQTRIPGRIVFLGFIKKHAVAVSECRFVIAVPDLKVQSQECKSRTKL